MALIPDFQVCICWEKSLVVSRATEGFFPLCLLELVLRSWGVENVVRSGHTGSKVGRWAIMHRLVPEKKIHEGLRKHTCSHFER